MLSSFLTFLLFCIALSADTFTAGLSYGSSGVRIPAPSKLILALVSGLMFTLSVFFSVFLSAHFPEKAVLLLSFLIFFCLSLYKAMMPCPSGAAADADRKKHWPELLPPIPFPAGLTMQSPLSFL